MSTEREGFRLIHRDTAGEDKASGPVTPREFLRKSPHESNETSGRHGRPLGVYIPVVAFRFPGLGPFEKS